MPTVIPPKFADFWQGDIFSDVPWSFIGEYAFVSPADAGRNRFTAIQPPNPGAKCWLASPGGRGPAMLLSHECVVDKNRPEPLAFARVVPIRAQPSEEGRENVRNGSLYAAFYLPPPETPLSEESYVDFRFITAIHPDHLGGLDKIASLTDEGRNSLRLQLVLYWTREEPTGLVP